MPTIDQLLRAFAGEFGIPAETLRGRLRTKHVAEVRHLLCHAARDLTRLSLGEIGSALDRRDHTSIACSAKVGESLLRDNPELAAAYARACLSFELAAA